MVHIVTAPASCAQRLAKQKPGDDQLWDGEMLTESEELDQQAAVEARAEATTRLRQMGYSNPPTGKKSPAELARAAPACRVRACALTAAPPQTPNPTTARWQAEATGRPAERANFSLRTYQVLHTAVFCQGSRAQCLTGCSMRRAGPRRGVPPLLRSAIAFSARRALAAGIRQSTCSAAEAAYAERCDDQPAANPARCFDCPVDPAPAER